MVIKCLCFDGVKNSENCTFRFRKLYVSFSRLYRAYEENCNSYYVENGKGGGMGKGEAFIGEGILPVYSLTPSTTYYYRSCIEIDDAFYYGEVKTFTTLDLVVSTEQEVDMGLSVPWAGWNIGASKPEECGSYFAWGETVQKATGGYYDSWGDYKYYSGGQFSKYTNNNSTAVGGTADHKSTLEAADDAATANWGSGWRMPTNAELNELKSLIWVTTTYNGQKGIAFVNMANKAIFFPYAGACKGSITPNWVGEHAFYWTSSLSAYSSSDADCFAYSLDTQVTGYHYLDCSALRYVGRSVRAVRITGTPLASDVDGIVPGEYEGGGSLM